MSENFLYPIGAAFAVSLCSIIGIFSLFIKDKLLNKIIFLLVAFSAGAMMGGAFLHLLPEAVELLPGLFPFLIVLMGFFTFFLIERILHWRHCHSGKECHVHSFGYLNVFGDGIHNFIDGLILAASFAVDVRLGFATTLAIIVHEIPQEMGDFGVLIYAGFNKIKALILNYISASTVILGALVGGLFGNIESFTAYLLPFAAGGFIYISTTDLIPELKKETKLHKTVISLALFLAGIGMMYLLKTISEV
jgi:zinc and cadmium transporter